MADHRIELHIEKDTLVEELLCISDCTLGTGEIVEGKGPPLVCLALYEGADIHITKLT